MITDPDAPGYLYPHPGEQLWHRPWQRWVVVDDVHPAVRASLPEDEVAVTYENSDERAIVKLRSLEER